MSDILIKGMAMPKNGFITITVTSDGRVVGNSKTENGKFEYLDNEDIAKAVPVPPHGDLMDRDAVKEFIKPWSPEDEITACTIDTAKKLMYTLLNRAPTIIPAEPPKEEA